MGDLANRVLGAEPDQVFDTAQDRKVLDSIIARIRSSLPESVAAPPTAEEDEPDRRCSPDGPNAENRDPRRLQPPARTSPHPTRGGRQRETR